MWCVRVFQLTVLLILLVFPSHYLVLVFQKEVDVIETVLQAVFLIAVYLKLLAVARCLVKDGLVGQVNRNDGLWVLLSGRAQLGLELGCDDNGQHEAVEQVVAVYVGE